MVRYISEKQLAIKEFKNPFERSLLADNRWVKLATIVPWEAFSNLYISLMNLHVGSPGISPRIILGALISKHKENLSDQKTIKAIQENSYRQFFVGLEGFQTQKVFDASLFVTIRKRIGKKEFDTRNTELIKSISHKKELQNISKKTSDQDFPPNKGKLQADATVADQYISYPTDANLLNSSRKKLDEMIDKIYYYQDKKKTKPRTYKRVLNTAFFKLFKKEKQK